FGTPLASRIRKLSRRWPADSGLTRRWRTWARSAAASDVGKTAPVTDRFPVLRAAPILHILGASRFFGIRRPAGATRRRPAPMWRARECEAGRRPAARNTSHA